MHLQPTQRLFSLGSLPLMISILWLSMLGGAVILTERPVGSISGQVVTAKEKRPLAGARIILTGPTRRVGRARPDGTYRIDRVPVGNYRIQAALRGYDSQWHSGSVAIEEGRITGDVNFVLMQRDPELHLGYPQRVFIPGGTVRINARGVLFSQFELELRRISLDPYLKTTESLDSFDELVQDPGPFPYKGTAELLARWTSRVLEQNVDPDDGWFYQQVEVPARQPGSYLLTARGTSDTGVRRQARMWFTVSRIGLITKHAADEMLVYATDLTTNAPRAGVRVTAFGKKGQLAQGMTDAQGLWRTQVREQGSWLVYARDGDSPAVVNSYFETFRDLYTVYSYSERPVYRPGQVVYFKGILRRKDANAFQVPRGMDVQVEVLDTKDRVVKRAGYRVNRFGSYHGEAQLPDTAPLGEYTLRTIIGKETHSTTFKVLEYRKPEYKLEITSEQKQIIQGQPIRATVRASYYFGSPASGIKVHFTVYAAPYFSFRSEEDDFFYGFGGDDSSDYWGFGDVVQEGDAITDPQGQLLLTIPTRHATEVPAGRHTPTYDQRYTLQVEATDISRRPVSERYGILVTQGAFRIRLKTGKYLYAPGEPIRLQLDASDYDNKPVPDATMTLVISREEQVKGRTEEEPVDYKYYRFLTIMMKTDAQGKATWTGKAPGEGYLNFQAQARDQIGNTITADHWTWVSSERFAWSGVEQPVNLVFDKQVYRPGEQARVLIASPVEDVTALLTVEGPKIYYVQVLRLPSHARLIRLPVSPDYAPNVHVSVSITHGKTHYQRSKSLNVSPRSHFLALTMATDKQKYGPGEAVRYRLKATDERGRPAQAEVSLGVVDAAIYAISPEETPDIRRFFWGPRANDVYTNYSFAEEYSGGGDKDLGKERVRRNFRDTAAWFPTVETGKDGQAQVTVSLPDNLSTWVATARGVTADTAVGSVAGSVISTKDLLVRLVTPRFFVQNDRLAVSTIVHNNTTQEQSVAVQLRTDGMRIEEPAVWKTAVPAGGLQGHDWPVTVVAEGPHSVTAWARGHGLRDALELTLPIMPHGIAQYIPFTDAVPDNGSTRFQFTLPPSALSSTWLLQVNLSPTPASAMVAALHYLSTYPYGCVEQTMDAFMPAAVALEALGRLDLIHPKLQAALPRQMQNGLQKLSGFQHSDGGWGWWKHDDSQPYLSAYVVYGLSLAQQARQPVDSGMIQSAVKFLRRAERDLERDVFFRHWAERGAGPDTRAYILHALSYQNAADTKELDRLWPEREFLSTYALALFTLALANAGRYDDAMLALRDLGERAESTENKVHWESRSLRYSWIDSDIEATAYALKAYLRLAPEDPKIPGAVRWLLAQRQGDRWTSTKDSAAAVLALADYLRARLVEQAPTYTARVVINDKEAGSFAVDRSNMFDPDRALRLKGQPLVVGDNRVQVVKEGFGPLQVAAAVSYTGLQEDIQAETGHGLAIRRTYYLLSRLARQQRNENAPFDFYKPQTLSRLQLVPGQVRSGETILVHLEVTADDKYQYVILEDPLPAGAEVVEEQEDRWRFWWAEREVHDDRVAFFFTRVAKGPQHVFYVLRPQLPGDYHVLPARAYGMYTPEVRGHSAEMRLAIKP